MSRRTHFRQVDGGKLCDAFHLIGHDAVDHFGNALSVSEQLADSALARPDVGKYAFKFFDAILGETLRAIFTAIADVNQLLFGDVVRVGRHFLDQFETLADGAGTCLSV